jgi:deoxyribonuclease V
MDPQHYDRLSPKDAVELQRELAAQLQLRPLAAPPQTIAGADISYNKFSDIIYAGIVVLSFPELQVIDSAGVRTKEKFLYIPGLLGFRELPPLMEVWDLLQVKPDVLVLDGHGTAHPRRMGIATHFGIVTGHPAIGCAKSLLTGHFEPLADKAGSVSDLIGRDGGKIGEVVRTKDRCNPVYVSPGSHITQEEATGLMLRSVTKYRIPEPTRQAHLLVNRLRTADGAPPRELF